MLPSFTYFVKLFIPQTPVPGGTEFTAVIGSSIKKGTGWRSSSTSLTGLWQHGLYNCRPVLWAWKCRALQFPVPRYWQVEHTNSPEASPIMDLGQLTGAATGKVREEARGLGHDMGTGARARGAWLRWLRPEKVDTWDDWNSRWAACPNFGAREACSERLGREDAGAVRGAGCSSFWYCFPSSLTTSVQVFSDVESMIGRLGRITVPSLADSVISVIIMYWSFDDILRKLCSCSTCKSALALSQYTPLSGTQEWTYHPRRRTSDPAVYNMCRILVWSSLRRL